MERYLLLPLQAPASIMAVLHYPKIAGDVADKASPTRKHSRLRHPRWLHTNNNTETTS
ncbi:hypothetical protein HNR39_001752 [Glaciimonas immobilis]|uniref:Uncharacterized protein n=1 Tax=Glaciimonas immobilis TaxID=728004 RepID=A0A840RTP5_9BURK|nr:hypothetical protein [Glaciimonas immobilis]